MVVYRDAKLLEWRAESDMEFLGNALQLRKMMERG